MSIFKTLIFIGLFVSFSAHARFIPPYSNGNQVLSGFENGCQHTKEFDAYINSICLRRVFKNTPICEPSKNVVVPKGFNIKDYTVSNMGVYSTIRARIRPGTLYWRGISVLYIETIHGHDNSINGQRLILDVDNVKEALSILKSQNGKLNKVLLPGIGNIEAKFVTSADQTALSCELPIF